MYLYLGQDTVINTRSLVGIFDLETTSVSRLTRAYLSKAQRKGIIVEVSPDLPKSFVVCREKQKNLVYLSQISPATLRKRMSYMKDLSNL